MVTAMMVLFVLLFFLMIVWQCVKRGLLFPLMKRGWFNSFDLDSIADQLVVEVSDYSKERRKKANESVVNLSPSDSRDQSALDNSTVSADHKGDETL